MQFEFAILDFIRDNISNGLLNRAMVIITTLGNGGLVWILAAIAMLISKNNRKPGVKIAIALIFSFLICNLCLKPIVARPRPFIVNGAWLIIAPPTDFSFPSGHTAASFAASVTLIINKRRPFSVCALILAFLIAFSRLYLYVHYPTDVLAGMIFGTIFAIASCKIVDAAWKKD